MRLLVAIPTWNRASYLDNAIMAVQSARAHARNCEVELFVSDNCSSDQTQEVMARWQTAPWIHYRRWDEHKTCWVEVLKRVLGGSGLEYDYLWLQGDDDYVCDPTAYALLADSVAASPDDPPAVVHCCQGRRAHPGDTRVIKGKTEDLCNTYGWHDMLGWISSLVISRDTVERMLGSKQWDIGTRSAFSHSETLLEAAYGRTMMVIAAGLMEPQDKEQTAETLERWKNADTRDGYWMVIPGLLALKTRGVLAKPLTLTFFRYQVYSFWDRYAVELLSQAASNTATDEYLENRLSLLGLMADLLSYSEDRKLFETWFEGFRDDVRRVRRTIHMIDNRLGQSSRASYDWKILPPSTGSLQPQRA